MVLSDLSCDQKINAQTAYKIAKFLCNTERDYIFYFEEIDKLLDKYSDETSDGHIHIPADRIESFGSDVQELQNIDAEDPNIRFKISELPAELKISIKQIYPLLDFIEEEN
jgi:hypothetical protein